MLPREPTSSALQTSLGALRAWRWQGASQRPVWVALHGFGGCGLDFEAIASADPECNLVALDLPGHGASDGPPRDADYRAERQALAVADAVVALDLPEPAGLLGYSMGARLALGVALAHPELLSALALVSATAGLEGQGERAERRSWDHAMAAEAVALGARAFDEEWGKLPLIAESRAGVAEPWSHRALERRARNDPSALGHSLRAFGTGSMPAMWAPLATMRLPTRLLVGERDDKYVALASRLAATLPDARVTIVKGAGHAPHLEDPVAAARWLAA